MVSGTGGPARLAVGIVAGAHGIRGCLRVQLHDPASEALAPGSRVWLVRAGAAAVDRVTTIERVEPVPGGRGRFRVTLGGIDDRDSALALRGCDVMVEREALEPLERGEFWLADAIGLPVVRLRAGTEQALGTVVGLTTNGAQDLFEIELVGERGRKLAWLLPVLPQFVLDVDGARVLVDPPLGMLPDELEDEA